MTSRYFWAALLALVVVALVTVVWLRWPRVQGTANRCVAAETYNHQAPLAGKGSTGGEDDNQGANNGADSSSKNGSAGVNNQPSPQPDQPPPNDEILVKGRVVFSDGVGREILEALGLENIELLFQHSGMKGDDGDEDSVSTLLTASLGGVIEQVTARDTWPLDDKGCLLSVNWRITLNLGATTILDPAPSPKLTGNVLDLGDLTFNFAETRSGNSYVVTGWISHTSGAVAANVDYLGVSMWDGTRSSEDRRGVVDDDNVPRQDHSVRTNDKGFFAEEIEVAEPERYKWYVSFPDFSESMRPDRRPDHAFACTPTIKGRVIDFGRVAINCGLVRARISGLVDEKTRLKIAGPDAEGKGLFSPTVSIIFSGLDSTDMGTEFDASGNATIFLPRGPYDYYLSVDDPFAFYETLEGSVMLDKGQVQQLDLKLKHIESVLVVLRAADGSSGTKCSIMVSWEALDGEWTETVAHLSILIGQKQSVPRRKNARLKIKASAEDWESIEAEFSDPGEVVTLEFKTRAKPTAGKVIIQPPPPSSWEHLSNLRLIIRRPSEPATEINANAEQVLAAGAWEVLLREMSLYHGYPDAVACGPVSFTVEVGNTTTVVLPPVAPAPWPQGCRGYRAMLTCEGNPVSYEGYCKYGKEYGDFSLDYGQPIGRVPLACAVMDGSTQVPLELVPPPALDDIRQQAFAEYRYDFPCRLEIRVTRRGRAIHEPLTIRAKVRVAGADSKIFNCQASTVVTDGKPALLWLPSGTAELTVEGDGFFEGDRSVEIKVGARVVVEWAVGSSLLKLEWDSRYQEEDGTEWLIRDDKGNVVNVVDYHTPQVSLKDGRYFLRPQLLERTKEHELQVELGKSAEDQVLQIPFVAAQIYDGEILLPYPQGLPLTAKGYWFRICWFSAAAGNMKQAMAELAPSQPSLDYRFTTEGVRIVNLPLKQDIVFLAAIAGTLSGDFEGPGKQGWSMRPRVIRLETGELKKLDSNIWSQAVVLDSKWESCVGAELKFVPVDNLYGVWYLGDGMEGWLVLPAGDYVIHVKPDEADDKKPLEFRLTLRPATGYFDIPADIAARLTKEGLYDPPPDPDDG